MRKEAATSHLLRGIMLWQKVDRQFNVPLENGRSFSVNVSASKLLQCTCVCKVSPHICFVHSGPAPRPMIHRVVLDDRALMCEHGVLHSSPHPCQHQQCKDSRALLQEHLNESICFPDPPTHPTGEQEEVVILTASACGSSIAAHQHDRRVRTVLSAHTRLWALRHVEEGCSTPLRVLGARHLVVAMLYIVLVCPGG